MLRDSGASLEDGAPYQVGVFTLAPVFVAADENTVMVMPLSDEQIAAGQVTLAAWAEADG